MYVINILKLSNKDRRDRQRCESEEYILDWLTQLYGYLDEETSVKTTVRFWWNIHIKKSITLITLFDFFVEHDFNGSLIPIEVKFIDQKILGP